MPLIDVRPVVLVAVTAPTAQLVEFPGYVEWCIFQNDSPSIVSILGHDQNVIAHIPPGDTVPEIFGDRDFNSLRVFANAPTLAADMPAPAGDGNILYIKFKLKRRT